MSTNNERRPKGWDIEQTLIARMEERFRDGRVSDEIAEYFEYRGEEREFPVLPLGERKQRTTQDGGDDAGGTDELRNSSFDGPPPTNRGVTFHQSADDRKNTCPRIMGGYDGGVEVGFDGEWKSPFMFKRLLKKLETAKEAAKHDEHPSRIFELGGVLFRMSPKTAGGGVTYKYVFEGGGVKFYVHETPSNKIQPVRIRYFAEGLIGRDLFLKHRETLDFLRKIGFHVEKEKISRIDMQVMLFRNVSEFFKLIFDRRIVCSAQKYSINGKGLNGGPSTFTLGSRIQICIYDKRAELFDTMKGNPQKFALMVQECFGEEWLKKEIPVTRIEFRLRREILKDMGIDSMQDLLEHEAGLVRYCTHSWFRMVSEPKKTGHTHDQETAPLWREVQEAFEKWFPGVDGHRKDVDRGKRTGIRCNAEHLIKQAQGCLASAVALSKGVVGDVGESLSYAISKMEEQAQKLFNRAVERARDLGLKGESIPFDDPRYACDYRTSRDFLSEMFPNFQREFRFCND